MNILYSTDLYRALLVWNEKFISLGYSFKMPGFLGSNSNPKGIPINFTIYAISQNFLINFWESLVILLTVMLLFLLAYLTEFLLNKNNKNIFIARKIRIVIQNLLLTQLYLSLGDIILFACLEWSYPDFSQAFTISSFVLSIVLAIIPIACLTLQLLLLIKFQSYKRENPQMNEEVLVSKCRDRYPASQIFFRDFKSQSLTHQIFLFLLILRDFIFSVLIALLAKYPLVQAILFLILSLPLGIFIFLFKPFKSRWNLAQQMSYEIMILIVSINIIIMAIFDQSNLPSFNNRRKIGKLIIGVQICFVCLGILVLTLLFISLIKHLYKNWNHYKDLQARSGRLQNLNSRLSRGVFPVSHEDLSHDTIIIQDGSLTGSGLNDNSRSMIRREEVFNFDSLEVQDLPRNKLSMSNTYSNFRRNQKKLVPISSRSRNMDSSFSDQTQFDTSLAQNLNRRKPPVRTTNVRRNTTRRQMNKSMSVLPSLQPGFSYLRKNEGRNASKARVVSRRNHVHQNSSENTNQLNVPNATITQGFDDSYASNRSPRSLRKTQILFNLNQRIGNSTGFRNTYGHGYRQNTHSLEL